MLGLLYLYRRNFNCLELRHVLPVVYLDILYCQLGPFVTLADGLRVSVPELELECPIAISYHHIPSLPIVPSLQCLDLLRLKMYVRLQLKLSVVVC